MEAQITVLRRSAPNALTKQVLGMAHWEQMWIAMFSTNPKQPEYSLC